MFDKVAVAERLSADRLRNYYSRVGEGDVSAALDLYSWNQDAGAAINRMLQHFEVCLRNSVAKSLRQALGDEWFRSKKLSAYTSDIERLLREVEAKARENRNGFDPSEADFIAATSFGFWREICKPAYAGLVWGRTLRLAFPHGPAEGRVRDALTVIHAAVGRLAKLRNRIAHHEHLFGSHREAPGEMLSKRYSDIVTVMNWMDPNFLGWMLHRDQFPATMVGCPLKGVVAVAAATVAWPAGPPERDAAT